MDSTYDAHVLKNGLGRSQPYNWTGNEDLNTVLIVLIADDVAKARQFATDLILEEVMQKGGVRGKPEFMLLNIQMMDTTENTSTAEFLSDK